MKKILAVIFAIAVAVLAAAPVSAHGHGGGMHRSAAPAVQSYAVCPAEDCLLTGLHTHGSDAQSYAGHSYNDGHDYHGYCGARDCTLTGYHEHDGSYCFGHVQNDGHGYHDGNGYHH